jgi:tetratricopeptide (TPR) repeat protein
MTEHRLRIEVKDGNVNVAWRQGTAEDRSSIPVPFAHPFDEAALTDLRWYLEEYLSYPYGLEPEKAKKIEGQMQKWGQALFTVVFDTDAKSRQFFQAAVASGLDNCNLSIVCDEPSILNLPWELLYTADEGYLAPSLGGMYRSLSGQGVKDEWPELPGDRLNVLLVIARPYGERDIALKTVARSVLAAIDGLPQINLKVLRPPSFDEFQRELNSHKGFYHIVHFDGHGDFDQNVEGTRTSFGAKGEGELVFEGANDQPQVVTATQIAQSLQNCRVPLFLLNACRSGEAGEVAFSSVAGQLVKLGAKGVVAMAYSVYAEAAKHFIGEVYRSLVGGNSVATAVAAGRRKLMASSGRPSAKGMLPLQDWLVPVLYQQVPYTPFVPRFGDELAVEEGSWEDGLVNYPDDLTGRFVGRDYDLLRLERGLRRSGVVLLQAIGGMGKTSLACELGRWWLQTKGCERVFFSSFAQGATVVQVVGLVGRSIFGDRFLPWSIEQQYKEVVRYLKAHGCLLIWDNFEPVNGFPAGNPALLSAAELVALRRFLVDLRGGKSGVVITSRREEEWLRCDYELVELRGLRDDDAKELAGVILAGRGIDRATLPPEYLELFKILRGHPLSLRVILPLLKSQSPLVVLAGLRSGEAKGLDELELSLDYSFQGLSAKAQRHLPFLGLFIDRVDVDWLSLFSSDPGDADGQAYQGVFGDNLTKDTWQGLLEEAKQAGILTLLGNGIYQIHPALPWYLKKRLVAEYGNKLDLLEQRLLIFYAGLANSYQQQLVGNAEVAMFVLRMEEPNLLQQLRLAEQCSRWSEVQAILQALGKLYQRNGRRPEFRVLCDRGLGCAGQDLKTAKAQGKDAFDLWMYIKGEDANELLQIRDLAGNGAVQKEILDELLSLNDPSMDNKVAIAYHNLGVVAKEQRQFDTAIEYYQKSLKIHEDAGDWHSAASGYHNLGVVAEEQRQFDTAIEYYQKSLKIYEDAGDLHSAASGYHNLGVVAEGQRQFDTAIEYYQKALKIHEDAGDWHSAASGYHNLGVVAEEQRQFDTAIEYYQKSLKIREDAGDWHNAASDYHQLGTVAQKQRQFDTATEYYQKSLKIREDAGDWHNAANQYHQLGTVAQQQRQFDTAIDWAIKATLIFQKYQDDHSAEITFSTLVRIRQELGGTAFVELWAQSDNVDRSPELLAAIQEASAEQENAESES